MNISITYASKFGNGKKCMEFLHEELSKKDHQVELHSVEDVTPLSLPSSELYIFSAPTQAGNLSGKMKKFLKKAVIPQKNAQYALITTCLKPPKTKSLKTMEALLQSKDISKAMDGLMIQVAGMKGPCEEGHLDQLKAFAEKVSDLTK
jgi:menaquinone-dependent protoporphyrinogen IX oxidase